MSSKISLVQGENFPSAKKPWGPWPPSQDASDHPRLLLPGTPNNHLFRESQAKPSFTTGILGSGATGATSKIYPFTFQHFLLFRRYLEPKGQVSGGLNNRNPGCHQLRLVEISHYLHDGVLKAIPGGWEWDF